MTEGWVDGDIKEVDNARFSFYDGAWHEVECTCADGVEGSENCIYRFPPTWPRRSPTPGRVSSDVRHLQEHICKALDLIDYHDDGLVPASQREGFATRIDLRSDGSYNGLVWDAEGWKSGRPKHGEPRHYRITVTIEDADHEGDCECEHTREQR